MSAEDLELVRALIRPLANKIGGPLIAPRIMAGITEENLQVAYAEVGVDGIRAAAEALIRIGKDAEHHA